MKKKVLVVAPHPDDETLGCAGTLLKHKDLGDEIYWLIVTAMSIDHGFSLEQVKARQKEIYQVADLYGFEEVISLKYPTTKLDRIPTGELISCIGEVFNTIMPNVIYLPFSEDVHTDHKIVANSVISCTKWFRYSSIKRVLCYETLSETEFGLSLNSFKPNVFIDISDYFNKKLDIMSIYKDQMGTFPFPRSKEAIHALNMLRGAGMGRQYAEAFMLLKELW